MPLSSDNASFLLPGPYIVCPLNSEGFNPTPLTLPSFCPSPQVGVFASRGESLSVVEYSELDPSVASAPDPEATDGTLMYNWGNICMHYFSTKWLLKVCSGVSYAFI